MSKTTVTNKGFEITGEVVFSKTAFRFEVWNVCQIATGKSFQSIGMANAATNADLSAREIGEFAALEKGADYLELSEMDNETDSSEMVSEQGNSPMSNLFSMFSETYRNAYPSP